MEQLDVYREWLDPHLTSGSADLTQPMRKAAPRLYDLAMRAGSGEGVQKSVVVWIIGWWVLVVGALMVFEPRLGAAGCLVIPLAFLALIAGSLGVVLLAAALRGDLIASLLGEPVMRVSAREIHPGDSLDVHFSQPIRRDGVLQTGSLRLIQRIFHIGVDSDGDRQVTHTDTTALQSELLPGAYMGRQDLEIRDAFRIPADAQSTTIGEKEHQRWFLVVDLDFEKLPAYQETYEITVVDG
jgi:hypothetical protein